MIVRVSRVTRDYNRDCTVLETISETQVGQMSYIPIYQDLKAQYSGPGYLVEVVTGKPFGFETLHEKLMADRGPVNPKYICDECGGPKANPKAKRCGECYRISTKKYRAAQENREEGSS